jgi:streptogramin lyase
VKRYLALVVALAGAVGFGVAVEAQRGAGAPATPAPQGGAPAPAPGGFGRGNPQQAQLEQSVPQLAYEAVHLPLMPEGHTIGETVGVALNSRRHLFVATRSGNAGPAKGAAAAQLFEFDQNNRYVKEWGPDNYAASFAHVVRIDKDDNVWTVDEGSNTVVKYNPQGLVTLVLGRKVEAIDYIEEHERDLEAVVGFARGTPPPAGRGFGRGGAQGCGGGGGFGRPTDVAWDTEGNIYIADGYTNSRVVKFDKDGAFVKCVGRIGRGSQGAEPLQFSTPHTMAADAKGNIYIGDRGNQRIQVLDPNLNLVRMINTVRAPWGMCITPPNAQGQQFIYSADAGGKIYKTDLEGKLLGWFGTFGKKVGQFHWVHSIHCTSENEILTGEAQNWRIQKITLKKS